MGHQLVDFRITYQYWQKAQIVREGNYKPRYHILLKDNAKKILDFSTENTILSNETIGGMLYMDRVEGEYLTEGYVKPNSRLNPTKDVPSFVKLLDKGNATFLEKSSQSMKVEFKGSKLKGIFSFTNVNDFWTIKRVNSKE